MFLQGVSGKRWVDFLWVPALGPTADSGLIEAMAAVERDLTRMWAKNAWAPGQTGGAGLVFPVKQKSLHRAHTEPGQVQVGYAVSEGKLCAAVILHLDKAIGAYAAETMRWAARQFDTPNIAFVRSLCVSETFRGFGIGREMLIQTRRRARNLGASGVVSHLRVSPERDKRVEKAYRDAGFDITGDAQTATVRQTIEHEWRAMFGREEPVDIDWLPGSSELVLNFVPVAATTAKSRQQPVETAAMATA